MKKITYSIVLLWSVLFCSCQKEDTLTTVPDGGVQLNFSGAQANLSAGIKQYRRNLSRAYLRRNRKFRQT